MKEAIAQLIQAVNKEPEKCPNPKRQVLGSDATSSQNPSHKRDDLVLPVNLNETPTPTAQDEDLAAKPNNDGASEIGVVDVVSTVVPEEIGFLKRKGRPQKWRDVSLEEPPVTNPPKWDGTLTPSMPEEIACPAHEDDEVPLNLVFNGKARTVSQQSSKVTKGKKRGPVTQGTTKKSMDAILQESCRNTMKWCRLSRAVVLEDEALSTQLVELDTENPPRVVEESPKTRGEFHRSSKGWKHLFEPPMTIMYENEVSDFYSSFMFTNVEETMYVIEGGVEISLDSISLGRIFDVLSDEEFTVEDKQASKDFLKLIGKL
ncbi:hypothetical protein HAX54_027058 [Datura stramonium]|uniref:Uncharacterized protein n=1 Tax=Datura stramonium TaxID=4076 RepID=A0ABS8S8H4_DATST|nr:hypothetical protein [Datura stramonium]